MVVNLQPKIVINDASDDNYAVAYKGAWWYNACTQGESKWIVLEREQKDCLALFEKGCKEDGIYTIEPVGGLSIQTWCDMKNGGWTVIQRRLDGSENFYRTWTDYVCGFGDISGEYWLGLENIHGLTTVNSSLKIEMEAFEDVSRDLRTHAYAQYDTFRVDDEDSNFRLHVNGFSGNCGDSLRYHDGNMFSTKDRDNDESADENCAHIFEGAWWYKYCHKSNLNGLYLSGNHSSYANGEPGSMLAYRPVTEQKDCLALFEKGCKEDGIYTIEPVGGLSIQTWCDMKNGGWTVIQRRLDGSEDFYRTWTDYVCGFGIISGEYWLGLENIHELTTVDSSLRIEMEAFEDVSPTHAYAQFHTFRVDDEDSNFRLHVNGFSGNCGDSLSYHDGNMFSTKDKE
ncbi:protein scabrous-like [Ruditapes philippinarum]|uniref:protein scabrous-like n=1 Tax=Ruditapes philippinarum TaxID=129788 RepID=UPI00295AAFD9|nr:protein scabrous-like [Ruditapes philippinarum]